MQWTYRITPTIAVREGRAFIVQCTTCGVLMCVPDSIANPGLNTRKMGPCPRCSIAGWQKVDEPVGPFKGWEQGTLQLGI